MSEFRRPRPEDTFIWPSATWEAGLKAMLREIVVSKGYELWGGSFSADTGVLGGFSWMGLGLDTLIAPGVAIVRGTADPGKPDFEVIYSERELWARHDAPDIYHRLDTVSLVWSVEPDKPQLLGRVGNALPALTNTQAGCACSLLITKGTPTSGVPVAPEGPTGSVKLYEIYVSPDGDLFGIDARKYAPGPSNRPGAFPISVHTPNTATTAELFNIDFRATGRGTMPDESRESWNSSMQWSKATDWPAVYRGRGAPGEASGPLYPMMIPGGREWWRSVSWLGFVATDGHTGMELQRLTLTGCVDYARTASTISNLNGDLVTLPVDGGRGLELVAAVLRYQVTQAFGGGDGPVGSTGFAIYRTTGPLGVVSDPIGTATLELDTTHETVQPLQVTIPSPPVLAPGDTLHAVLRINRSGTTGGILRVFGVDLKFREGRQ